MVLCLSSGTVMVQGMSTPFPLFIKKNIIEMTNIKKKRVCWVSEVFTLIILKKAYHKHFKINRLYRILYSILCIGVNIYSGQLSGNLSLVHPFISGKLIITSFLLTEWSSITPLLTMEEDTGKCCKSQLVLLNSHSFYCVPTSCYSVLTETISQL